MARTAASAPYRARALVLRVRSLGEKDRVLTLLAPDHGKFYAVARGARGGKSKLAAVAQPFVLARFLLARGRNLDIVTQAEIEEAPLHLTSSLLKTAWATYLCELCDALPEALPDTEVFNLLQQTLQYLDSAPDALAELQTIGRWCETHFLSILGYAPVLGRCAACDAKISVPESNPLQRIDFSAHLGGNLCQDCISRDAQRLSVSAHTLRTLFRLQRTATPPAADRLQLSSRESRELRDCIRACLSLHLDVKIKSLRFLDDLQDEAILAANDG